MRLQAASVPNVLEPMLDPTHSLAAGASPGERTGKIKEMSSPKPEHSQSSLLPAQ